MPSARSGLTIGLLACVTAIAFETQAVLTAMPAAAEDLGRLDLYAWAFTAMVIPQIVAVVLAGRLCDSLGPYRPLALGLALFAAGVALAGAAPAMPVLLGGRFVQGLGAGAVNLALMVVTARAYGPAERARVLTWYSAAWMLPSFLGPAVAAWLTGNLSWRWVFWAILPLVMLGALLTLPTVRGLPGPEADADPGHRPPARAALAVAIGVALVQLAGQRLTVSSTLFGVAGGLALVVFLPALMPPGFSVRVRGLSAVVGVRGLTAGAFFGVQSFLPLMLVQQRGVSLLVAGGVITIGSAGWLAGSWLQSRPWLRARRDHILTAGAASVVLGVAALAASAWWPAAGVVVPVAAYTVAGLGMGLQSNSSALAVMQLSGPALIGRNSSSLQVGEMTGSALLTGLAGTVFAWQQPSGDVAATFGGVALAMSLGAVLGLVASLRVGPVPNQSITVSSR